MSKALEAPKRITIFAGHYGSGKTNIAVNYAERLALLGKRTVIADLDIVNPYFRTKDSLERLQGLGIRVISPEFANSNVDLPALPSSLYGVVESRDSWAVLDVGGDDRGAYALGRFTPYILEENNYEMVYVVNFSRPLTADPEGAVEIMREIESACGMAFTAIANNTNLGRETDVATLRRGMELASQLSRLTGLGIIFTSAEKGLADSLPGEELFGLELQKRYFDIN